MVQYLLPTDDYKLGASTQCNMDCEPAFPTVEEEEACEEQYEEWETDTFDP